MISSLALRLTPLFISSSRRAIFSTGYRAFSPFLGPRRVAAAEDNRRPFYKNNYLLSSQMSSTTDIAPLLPYDDHTHNSIKVTIPTTIENDEDDNNIYHNIDIFQSRLHATITTAKSLGKSALWMVVPLSHGHLLPSASELGLTYHHATGKEATLCMWLKDDIESLIPEYATHQVGVGAIVIRRHKTKNDTATTTTTNNDDDDELLVVREARNNYRPWKIPGGLAELGEHLDEAAIREVYEETGIHCRFVGVLGMRHTHDMQFGRSDLYFICRMEAVPNEDGSMSEPKPQAGEIEACRWLPLREFKTMVMSEDKNVGHPMMAQIMKVVDQSCGMERMILPSIVPKRKPSPLYHVPIQPDDKSS